MILVLDAMHLSVLVPSAELLTAAAIGAKYDPLAAAAANNTWCLHHHHGVLQLRMP